MSEHESWWEEWGDPLIDAGMALWNYNESQDANEQQSQDLQAGYQQANPWSMYQPAMGAGLVNLLADPSRITETPGYQFAYDQGLQALFAKQAATGQRMSGRAMTETMQYGQGLASQMYNQEMDRYASLAGANQGSTGNIGGQQAALTDQANFNQGYFLNQLFNTGNTASTSPTDQGTGGTLNLYNNDPGNIASP
jgi:hypothetical protein